MPMNARLESIAKGWRGRALAALIALIAGLPGALALPPLDRDESRIAEATAQMLETRDFVSVRYQDRAGDQRPVGVHWLQAASVAAVSSAEARQIWAYRIPSLLGAMLAAAALVWGVSAFYEARVALAAGAILAVSALASTEAGIASSGALVCGAVTLALAALAHVYSDSLAGERAPRRTKLLFWLGLGLAILDRGPIGGLPVIGCVIALWASDRGTPWLRTLGWGWGALVIAGMVGPWLAAITVHTDGGYWLSGGGPSVRGALLDGQGAWPGANTLLAPLMVFPAAALLPAAAILGWTSRAEPGVRFALCWLIPGWILLELLSAGSTLPVYGGLAWLAAVALIRPIGTRARQLGLVLAGVVGLAWMVAASALRAKLGDAGAPVMLALALILIMAATLASGWILVAPRRWVAVAAACGLGAAAHAAMAAGLAPHLAGLWIAQRTGALLDQTHLNPRDGLTPGPVTVIGFAEPSMVFTLGSETELGDPGDGAEAIAEGRPVVVEDRQKAAFLTELAGDKLKASPVGAVAGLDYATGRKVRLVVYRSDSPPPAGSDSAP
jgi:hypothetical protein